MDYAYRPLKKTDKEFALIFFFVLRFRYVTKVAWGRRPKPHFAKRNKTNSLISLELLFFVFRFDCNFAEKID